MCVRVLAERVTCSCTKHPGVPRTNTVPTGLFSPTQRNSPLRAAVRNCYGSFLMSAQTSDTVSQPNETLVTIDRPPVLPILDRACCSHFRDGKGEKKYFPLLFRPVWSTIKCQGFAAFSPLASRTNFTTGEPNTQPNPQPNTVTDHEVTIAADDDVPKYLFCVYENHDVLMSWNRMTLRPSTL